MLLLTIVLLLLWTLHASLVLLSPVTSNGTRTSTVHVLGPDNNLGSFTGLSTRPTLVPYLHRCLVLPTLDYCSSVWDPHTTGWLAARLVTKHWSASPSTRFNPWTCAHCRNSGGSRKLWSVPELLRDALSFLHPTSPLTPILADVITTPLCLLPHLLGPLLTSLLFYLLYSHLEQCTWSHHLCSVCWLL